MTTNIPATPVTSVFKDIVDGEATPVEIISAETDGVFVYQREKVSAFETALEMESVYTKDGHYVGDKEFAALLITRGITESVSPPTATGTTCAIGFNPTEQKWYGWSHRAINGFGIGSVVAFGDCAFSPSGKQELEESAKHFWEVGERVTASGETCVTTVKEIVHDTTHEDYGDKLGMLFRWTSTLEGKASLGSYHFYEYPEVWGRGAWTATTLEDAKQMAIDFADGVS